MSIHETVKTQKQYYLHNTRSAHFPFDRGLCIEREQEREREAMSIHEVVKTQIWYYLHNTRSAYFPIDRRLHRYRDREGETERGGESERLCPPMKL